MTSLQDCTGTAFSTQTAFGEAQVDVRLSGNADMDVVRGLAGYLKTLHLEVVRLRGRRVVVDVRDLYFMNSSCLKTLVTWITTVQEMEKTARYRIDFIRNDNLHWQRRSLDALRNLGTETVDVLVS
jgi:hypothetical protein